MDPNNYAQMQDRSPPVGYGYQSPANTPAADTPLNRLLSALSSLESATAAVIQTTDSLCGSQPTEGSAKSGGLDPSPSGMFAAVSLSANRIERMASVIAESMNRIQRVAG